MSRIIQIYDTTLRDGTQSEDIAFSVEDKLLIAEKLDWLGIHYIEGGWPGSNPKDSEFFERARGELKLTKSRLSAFGSTRRADSSLESDSILKGLLDGGTKTVCIFGKSWDLHVKIALGISLKENLQLIKETVRFLKENKKEVFFDAEHFFDGFKANKKYALEVLASALSGGADVLVLCDTNGGTLPFEISAIIKQVKQKIRGKLGIHCHNDGGVGVANSLAAVSGGALQVQGTINGIGERCGNANLCSVIPNLESKMGLKTIGTARLARLKSVSQFVDEMANRASDSHQAYVGDSAFAHKGGVHVHAMLKDSRTYEHINPQKIGNERKIVLSELSGLSTLLYKAKEFGIELKKEDPRTKSLLGKLKELENEGFQFEGAEASFEILIRKELGLYQPHFALHSFKVTDEISGEPDVHPFSRAEISLAVQGHDEKASATGVGPVHALDQALRQALERFYPVLKEVRLLDYKVRVLTTAKGTAATVRVLLECGDHQKHWATMGVSENIIQASYKALVDSIDYKLMKG